MRKKELKLVVELYKTYYKQITNNHSFRMHMSDNRATMVYNFINNFLDLTKSNFVQEDALKKFMEFQFNYWYKRNAKYGAGTSIQLEWIIGKKAIKRWEEADKKYISWIIRKNLKKDHKIVVKKKDNQYDSVALNISIVEEFEKERFFNTVKGYWNCIINTTMYNHKSEFCMQCNKSSKCKDNLKSKFPKIYKKRGY